MSKTARKKYRPRWVNPDPLSTLRMATPDEQLRVMLRFNSALDSLANSRAPGRDEWADLSDAINTVETMADLGNLKRDEVMPTVTAAIAAMVQAANRFKAGNRMGVDGPGLQALRDVVAMYQQAVDGLPYGELVKAQAVTAARIFSLQRRPGNRAVVAL